MFSEDPALNGLYVDDADIVAVYHTDDLGLGNIGSVGTIDFYANGGLAPQPGCDESSGGMLTRLIEKIMFIFYVKLVAIL